MPADTKSVRPIIVIKKQIAHGGHHGGAWKVAYADFVTAMMSLFIVLWLLNCSPQIKRAVAGYFNDPSSKGQQTGTLNLGSGETVSIDKQNVEKLKQEIEKAILKQADLTKLSKQIDITVTGEGLKIELIEDKGGTFFETGSPKLSDSGVELLNLLATQLKVLPNRLLIEGHTDAQPFSDDQRLHQLGAVLRPRQLRAPIVAAGWDRPESDLPGARLRGPDAARTIQPTRSVQPADIADRAVGGRHATRARRGPRPPGRSSAKPNPT